MKKYLLVAILFCLTNLLAQNKVGKKVIEMQRLNADFKPFSVLTPTQNSTDNQINKVVDDATLATLNFEKINEIVSNQYDAITLEIPYKDQIIPVLLYKVNPFSEGFHVDTDKGKNINYQKGVYYRGIIKGNSNSVSAFNFFNGEFNGIISSSELGNLVVGKLVKPNNQADYIVYSDAKMKMLNDFSCHIKDDGNFSPKNGETNRSINSTKCVSLYFEVDTNLYVANGSNITTTTNWTTSVFNNVQTLYNNDGISVGLKSIYIWTTQDPYENIATTAYAHLTAFAQNTSAYDGDAGIQIGIDPQPTGFSGLGGVAFLNTLCTSNAYAYADINYAFSTVPTYSWTIQAITHEFGHTLGSPHTHGCYWNGNNTPIDGCGQQAGYFEPSQTACPTIGPIPSSGTIMSYCNVISGVGINFANGFGPQPTALILSTVNNSSCLSSDCATSCSNAVAGITASNITPTSATITWNDTSSTSVWQVAVTPFSSVSIVWNTVNIPSFSASGLNPNTYYVIRIRPVCNGIQSLIRQKIFATTMDNFCDNVTFTDTGGISGNYSDMESWTRTMTPYNSGLKLRVAFSSFDLENTFDFLYIYNGPNQLSPLLTPNGLTGITNPGTFDSTAADGSLTFRFYSDQGTVASGWNATISCTGTLGTEESNFLDYSYYPNPTTGKVNITSKDAITEVAVYNVQGQLLFNQKMNELTTNVDISQFARGTYFFKLKINHKEVNFKILKM